MFRRRCPACGRKLLSSRYDLQRPFQYFKRCGYCGTQFRVQKSIFHYAWALVVWIVSLIVVLGISDVSGGPVIQMLLFSLILILTLRFTMHIGKLREETR
mgnify:CR=1 FL=1